MRTLASLVLLLALCGCQWGPPPRIPYVDGTTYVTPDGDRTPIHGQEKVGVSAVLPYADGLLVADTRWFEASVGLAHVQGTERTELDRQSLLFVAGFVGDAVVVAGWRDPVRLVPKTGPVTVVPHLRSAVDAHGTLVAGPQSVVNAATGRLLWWAPRTYLLSFSPDGRLLVGSQRGASVVLDARTGAVRATLPKRLDRLTWEDDRHLLGVTWGRGSEVMVRIGLDGTAELVGRVQPVPPNLVYRYVFETQP